MSAHSNFSFLSEHSPLLADLGHTAEKLYPFDPSSCVLKLRLLAEALTREMAVRLGLNLPSKLCVLPFRTSTNRRKSSAASKSCSISPTASKPAWKPSKPPPIASASRCWPKHSATSWCRKTRTTNRRASC